MIGDRNDCLAFELRSLPGVSKVTISVVTLFSLASEVCAKLFRYILGKNVPWVDRWITEVKTYPNPFSLWQQYQPLLCNEASLPLVAGRIVFVRIGCCRVALASITLFGCNRGVGSGTRCAICGGIPFIFPWSAGLSIISRIDGVGSNRTRHDRNGGHDSLNLIVKRLQDR